MIFRKRIALSVNALGLLIQNECQSYFVLTGGTTPLFKATPLNCAIFSSVACRGNLMGRLSQSFLPVNLRNALTTFTHLGVFGKIFALYKKVVPIILQFNKSLAIFIVVFEWIMLKKCTVLYIN